MTEAHLVRQLARLYAEAHDSMRNIDGLHPQEAFDELLKYLFFKRASERDQEVSGSARKTANMLRVAFRRYLDMANAWHHETWRTANFHLSDSALLAVHELFGGLSLGVLPFDIRSAALREFLAPELRRGLGIYLTPDNVVRMCIDVVSPTPSSKVYDPACGSGTFLTELLNHWRTRNKSKGLQHIVYGSDKNPRMLLLAELNLGDSGDAVFKAKLLDALAPPADSDWPRTGFFDCIFTNPPFGVVVDSSSFDLSEFTTACELSTRMSDPSQLTLGAACHPSTLRRRQQSEVLFIEKCLRYLKPAGTLAIVTPKSVVTNRMLAPARTAIDHLGYVYAVVSLPPETFAVAGTQTTTYVLFFRRFRQRERTDDRVEIAYADIANVGYDTTGRPRPGDQLPAVADDFRRLWEGLGSTSLAHMLPAVSKKETLSRLCDLISGKNAPRAGAASFRLGDFLELATTGRTPARSAYSESGLFLVKVGNLTGHGIDWTPRDRNFTETGKGLSSQLLLRKDDILLTSSAHSPKYIAKKVDIVTHIPQFVGGRASFVGEVMLLRIKPKVLAPLLLLAYLRSRPGVDSIQRMIRGQTAHLHPDDIMELEIPKSLLRPCEALKALVKSLLEETALAERQSVLNWEQDKLLNQLFSHTS